MPSLFALGDILEEEDALYWAMHKAPTSDEEVVIWASVNSTGDAALMLLLEKISNSESLLNRFEEHFLHPDREWSKPVASYLMDWMERKRDQIDYEKHRVTQIGLAVASGRDIDPLDI